MFRLLTLFSFLYIFCVSFLNASPGNIISGGDGLYEYYLKSMVARTNFILENFLKQKTPALKIEVEINNKEPGGYKVSYNSESKLLKISAAETAVRGYQSRGLIKELTRYLICAKFNIAPDFLSGSWLMEGSYRMVINSFNYEKDKRPYVFGAYFKSEKVQIPLLSLLKFKDNAGSGMVTECFMELSELMILNLTTDTDSIGLLKCVKLSKAIDNKKMRTGEKDGSLENEFNHVDLNLMPAGIVSYKTEAASDDILKYLSEVERRKYGIGTRYSLYFEALKSASAIAKPAWKELDIYLDRVYPPLYPNPY